MAFNAKKFIEGGKKLKNLSIFKKKNTKKGKWGSQSLANLKRRRITKKKISAKLRKYKYAGVEHKRIK
jgi:hypothetical protein